MALDLAASFDPDERWPLPPASHFLLALSKDGLWVIRETTGRKVGFFRRLKDAIKYARGESPHGNFTIAAFARPGREARRVDA